MAAPVVAPAPAIAYAAAAPVADGAEEEEQQGARASGARASGGRALRSRKVCETEAAGRHVRWQDTSVFERMVNDTMKALGKNNISINNLFLQVRQDSKFKNITEEKFFEHLDQVDKTRIRRLCCHGRNANLTSYHCLDCTGRGSKSIELLQ